MIKHILLWVAISLAAFTSVSAQPKTVKLSGTLSNYSNQVLLFNLSEYGILLPRTLNPVITPDSTGRFDLTMKIDKPGYYLLGRNHLYLSPGDQLEIISDAKKSEPYTTFKGTSTVANTYLTGNQYPNMGAYVYGGTKLQATPEATFDYIMKSAAQREEQLKSITGVTAEFKRLEAARIKADIVISLNSVDGYVRFSRKIATKDSFIKAFDVIAQPVKSKYLAQLVDPTLLCLPVYRNILPLIVDNAPAGTDVAPLKEYLRASQIASKMIAEHDKSKLGMFTKNIDSLTNQGYKAALKLYLKDLAKFGVGDIAKDFKGVDIAGKPVKLTDLKGKIIYIDFWATWCGPCLREMPNLEALKEKYKDDDRVVFLSISIDEASAMDRWKQNVKSRNAGGYQWHTDVTSLTPYQVTQIPRIILIDKDFKVVDMNGPWPSEARAGAAIEKLIK